MKKKDEEKINYSTFLSFAMLGSLCKMLFALSYRFQLCTFLTTVHNSLIVKMSVHDHVETASLSAEKLLRNVE